MTLGSSLSKENREKLTIFACELTQEFLGAWTQYTVQCIIIICYIIIYSEIDRWDHMNKTTVNTSVQSCMHVHTLWYSQVEWPFPAHLDLYQIVRPSSRSRKCRCFFHERDLTFLRVDPAIITLTSGSSWIPAQSHVKSHRSWSCRTSVTTLSKHADKAEEWTISNDCAITKSIRLYGLNTKLNFY